MLKRYHIRPNGEPGICRAEGQCPYGEASEHFSTPLEARRHFEEKMASSVVHTVTQKAGAQVEALLQSSIRELSSTRPSGFVEWEGEHATQATYVNMGLRMLEDRASDHRSRGSEFPYTRALEDLKQMRGKFSSSFREGDPIGNSIESIDVYLRGQGAAPNSGLEVFV